VYLISLPSLRVGIDGSAQGFGTPAPSAGQIFLRPAIMDPFPCIRVPPPTEGGGKKNGRMA